MENFSEILMRHFEKHPKMQPKDAVKLCYQSAKGCGHLIKNSEQALSMLKNEMENTDANDGAQLLEPIGNGYSRLDLHKAKAMGISPEAICDIFIKSAECGEKTELSEKVSELEKLVKAGKTPFDEKAFSDFMKDYRGEMISHSDEYRKEYFPAYRVVVTAFADGLQ